MQVSATVLGQGYGLTGEEMNRVLFKLGFLDGCPGNYSPTEKVLEYVVEKEIQRGTGGYSWYNRCWTTRTYDDSIKKVLNVSPDLIKEVRVELTAARAERSAAQAAARACADADFLKKQAIEKAQIEAVEGIPLENKELIVRLNKFGKTIVVIGGVIVIGYGIYWVTPKVINWWNNRKQSAEVEKNEVS